MDFSKLTLGDKILGGCAIVLLIDLVFLPWHSSTISYGGFSQTYSRTAIESPNSFWALLGLLILFAIIGTTIVRRLTDTELPETPRPMGELTFFATIALLVLLVLKLITKFEYLGFGAWLAILLAGGMIYGAFLDKDLPDDAPTGGGSGDGGPPTPF